MWLSHKMPKPSRKDNLQQFSMSHPHPSSCGADVAIGLHCTFDGCCRELNGVSLPCYLPKIVLLSSGNILQWDIKQ